MNNNSANEKRSWFGPKRIGIGGRPQTWQGFAVVIGFVIVVAVVVAGDGSLKRS
ncbi:MAG: hypothetical protein ABI137_13960 [Antricoccus sp.]